MSTSHAAPTQSSAPRPHRHLPTLLAVGGIAVGLLLTWVAGSSTTGGARTALLAVGGALAVGGPLLAVLLHLHARLSAPEAPAPRSTTIGLASGVVAIGVALALETLTNTATGKGSEIGLVLAGPIEELGKLLLPVVPLAAGVAAVRSVSSGIWTVAVGGAVFGFVEGIKYAARIGLTAAQEKRIDDVTAKLPADLRDPVIDLVGTVPRIWVELGHVFWTTGAAVLIWIAVSRGRRALGLVTLGAWLAAAALHSFNDGVLPAAARGRRHPRLRRLHRAELRVLVPAAGEAWRGVGRRRVVSCRSEVTPSILRTQA